MAEPPRPELLSFLGAIKAEPEEDTPKLALADWLQEQPSSSDQARGDFLRQFVRNNQLAKTDPAREDFGALVRLWNANEKAWARRLRAAGFAVWATNHMFRWGLLFPAHEWSWGGGWDDGAELSRTEEYAWVAGIAVRCINPDGGPAFVESPLFGSLIGLRVAEAAGSVGLVGQLCGTAREHRLRSLEIAFTGAPIYGIAQSPQLAGLRHLAVRHFPTITEFRYVCDSTYLKGLRVLDAPGAGLDAGAGHAFADGAGLPALTELNLGPGGGYTRNRLGPDGLRALFAGVPSGRLRKLNVASNTVGDAGVESLCAQPHMSNLTHLNLADNGVANRGAVAIAGAEHLETLEHLTLSGNAITNDGASALAGSPHLTSLRRLDLSANRKLGARAVATLRERFGDGVNVH